jgi:hypothetical protein
VGVAELLKDLPKADYSLADKGYVMPIGFGKS